MIGRYFDALRHARRRRVWSADLATGRRGEDLAHRYLRRLGYTIVARNYRLPSGDAEADLIAWDGPTLVIVEVKTRASHAAGHPAEAIDADKQRRLTRAALGYLNRHGLLEHRARFDVIAITWPDGGGKPTIEHLIDAFPAVGTGQLFN